MSPIDAQSVSPTDALVSTVRKQPIDCDGLTVAVEDDGEGESFRFETPETSRAGLSESELRTVADGSEFVYDWYFWTQTLGGRSPDRRAFLRWLEGDDSTPERYDRLQDGIARQWGQLRITVTLGEATPLESPRRENSRCYEVRHVADEDADRSSLERHTDPLDAQDLARYDSSEAYRPLKSAPTLRNGWVFPDLSAEQAVRTVQEFYPASIANWARERRDELDVTHFAETAERQTGIYAMVEELDPEAVEDAATACCADSECLKRREWEYSEDEQLDAPAGDGEIPCREPCSLFVATAREFAKVEREAEQTYELTLTPSEREQLERMVSALADGDQPRIGDAGDGANRLRARYLREKRFTGDD